MEIKEKLKLKAKIFEKIGFREGGDYFAFQTNTLRDAEVQDLTSYEFEGLIGEIIDLVEEELE